MGTAEALGGLRRLYRAEAKEGSLRSQPTPYPSLAGRGVKKASA